MLHAKDPNSDTRLAVVCGPYRACAFQHPHDVNHGKTYLSGPHSVLDQYRSNTRLRCHGASLAAGGLARPRHLAAKAVKTSCFLVLSGSANTWPVHSEGTTQPQGSLTRRALYRSVYVAMFEDCCLVPHAGQPRRAGTMSVRQRLKICQGDIFVSIWNALELVRLLLRHPR